MPFRHLTVFHKIGHTDRQGFIFLVLFFSSAQYSNNHKVSEPFRKFKSTLITSMVVNGQMFCKKKRNSCDVFDFYSSSLRRNLWWVPRCPTPRLATLPFPRVTLTLQPGAPPTNSSNNTSSNSNTGSQFTTEVHRSGHSRNSFLFAFL